MSLRINELMDMIDHVEEDGYRPRRIILGIDSYRSLMDDMMGFLRFDITYVDGQPRFQNIILDVRPGMLWDYFIEIEATR